MILQTAPANSPRLAIMMYQHTALCQQFAYAFGNDQFQPLSPLDLVAYVISNHDAGWLDFDREPGVDEKTQLPFNLVDTPARYIVVTSERSPNFNQRHHPYCGLISSMHSWGLYNGRYGLSDLVLLDKTRVEDRPRVEKMLAAELERQARLKEELAKDPETAFLLNEKTIFQNYKQLQFLDTLALYFNRIHSTERVEQEFQHVPVSSEKDVSVRIKPVKDHIYSLSPFPFAVDGAEFAFAGRLITPSQSDWPRVLRSTPTVWESFRLVAA